MDINELNKMSVVAQFNKLISQTNFIGSDSESFAGLLEKNTSDALFADSDSSIAVNNDSKPTFANDKADNKKEQVKEKEETPKKENKVDKEEKTTDKKDSKVEKEAKEDDKASDEKNEEEDKSADQKTIDAVVPQFAAQTQALSEQNTDAGDTLAEDILSGKVQVMDENGNILSLADLTAENLSGKESLQIINPQTQETIQISGAELAQKMADLQQVDSFEAAEELPQMELSAAKTLPADKKNVQTQNISDFEEILTAPDSVSEESLEQADALADKNIKIDWTVKEEKISYTDTKGLVKDALSLQETAEAEMPKESQPTTSQNLSTSASVQNKTAVNLTAALAPNAANFAEENNSAVQNMAVTDVKQVSSAANAGHSIMSGAEFVAAANAENAGKSNQTSVNDVYKGMSKEAVEQVKVNITKSAVKGVDTIEVRLKPEELGHIEIKMQIKNGKLQAHIISSRPETMEALQRDAQVLEKAFNDAGFQTDGNSLSFSFRNEGNQAQGQNDQLRNFIGKVFEQEANSDVITAEAANQNWSAETGLNIRV